LPGAAAAADVVVLWTLATALYAPVLTAARRRFGVSVHELLPGPLGTMLLVAAARPATWVQANSLAVARWIERRARRRAFVAYPAIEGGRRAARPAPEGPVRLVLAGRTNGRKGHEAAIDAVELARARGADLVLDLYGEPFAGQEKQLDSIIRRAGETSFASYRGGYPHTEPPFGAYDLNLFLPSAPESFGLVPVEAWAQGTRTLGVPLGGARESLGLVDAITVSGDVPSIARALEWVDRRRDIVSGVDPSAPAASACTQERRMELWARSLER
jgi:glycosyltransferase involved in cell wall biosynthesis